jgi:hypothetical protein
MQGGIRAPHLPPLLLNHRDLNLPFNQLELRCRHEPTVRRLRVRKVHRTVEYVAVVAELCLVVGVVAKWVEDRILDGLEYLKDKLARHGSGFTETCDEKLDYVAFFGICALKGCDYKSHQFEVLNDVVGVVVDMLAYVIEVGCYFVMGCI